MNRIGIIAAALFTVGIAVVVVAPFRTRDDRRIETDPRLLDDGSAAIEARVATRPESEPMLSASVAAHPGGDAPTSRISFDELVLAIVDSEERPVADVRIAIHRDGVLLARGVSDDDGRFRLPGAPGCARCTVASSDRPMKDVEIPLAGTYAITLDDGAACEGIVRVINAAHEGAIGIRLEQDDPVRDTISDEVREALGDLGRVPHRKLFTNDEGRFRFAGLHAGVPLTLVFGGGFVLSSDESRTIAALDLDAPRSGVLVELHLLPRAVGRLIDATSGQSVADRHVAVAYDANQGRATAGSSTDTDGRFSIPLPGVRSMPLLLMVVNGSRRIETPYDGPVTGVIDFGTIAVPSVSTWKFSVRDADGRAIAGARATVGGGLVSEPTDARGLGEITDDFTQVRSALVGARGYRSARVDVVQGPDERQVIGLERCNSLRVSTGAIPESLAPSRARLSGPRALRPTSFDAPLVIATSELHSLYDDGEIHEREQWLDPEGRAEFFDLGPDVAMTVAILDPDGQEIATAAVSPLGTEETREVRIDFDPVRFVVRIVEIVDEDGRPIADADVTVINFTERGESLVTDENGRFRLILERDAPLPALLVDADGYPVHEVVLERSATGVHREILRRDG